MQLIRTQINTQFINQELKSFMPDYGEPAFPIKLNGK